MGNIFKIINFKKYTIIGFLISILLFLIFFYSYENYFEDKALKGLVKDSKVLEQYTWEVDRVRALRYLNFIASYNKYRSIEIIETGKNVFIKKDFQVLSSSEKLLHKLGLLPLQKMKMKLYHKEDPLGLVNVVYYKTTIYVYILYAIINFFIFIIYLFLIYLIKVRTNLKLIVRNKTLDVINREKLLIESNEKWIVTINSIGDIFISTDLNGKIDYINPIGEEVFDYKLNFLKGKLFDNIFKYFLSENDHEQKYMLNEVLEGGSTVSHEEPILFKNRKGKTIYVLDKASPIFNTSNEIIGSVIILKDITKTYQLLEELRQAQKMESIGLLSGGIAHDFNNMLAGILGATEMLLLEENIPSEYKENLNLILKSSQKASHLTRKLLDFSRKGALYKEKLNANTELGDALSLLKRSIDKKVKIITKFESKFNTVKIDSSQFQNAIINIILNAKDAMEKNPLIEIKTSDFYADEDFCEKSTFNISSGNFIKISIKDNGSGMTKEVKEKIFEPFFTTKSVGKGTGLGLAAVYGTIIDYKGFIEVESEINKGTSISLFIPATESIKKLIVNKQRTVMKKYTGTILLVEDEDVVRDVAHNLLTKLGFETLVAENGKEAVDIFKKHESKISLVVMDIVMPVMDGREAFYELKEINKDVKVILLSGFKREASINSLLEEGVKGFLQKPYTIQAFREKVVEVLGQ